MKSIREWRIEKEGVSPQKLLEFNLMTSLRNFAGGSTLKQDSQIRSGLRSKILSLWKDAQESGMTALDFVRQVWAVAGSAVTGRMGGNLNVANTAKGLSAPDSQQTEWNRLSELVLKEMEGEYKIDKTLFTRFAGGTSLDIDSEIKSELRPKILKLMKDAGIGSGAVRGGSGAEAEDEDKGKGKISKAELFKKIVAAVAAIEAEVTSGTASVASLTGGLNASNEDIAKI
jgi:hypothetical protein